MKKQNNKSAKVQGTKATKAMPKIPKKMVGISMEIIDGHYNRKQAAKFLGISVYAVDQLILKNKLKSLKLEIVKSFKFKK